ncbi:apiosidase-like domain-containing protein [Algoriphagus alkaliphilus]|nr:DUF4038 domain-containing protein [Algoriphagus alkaliphilus]
MTTWVIQAQEIKGPILVHRANRYLMTSDGSPFFWMADTAWELFHRLDQTEAVYYPDTRKEQGFNWNVFAGAAGQTYGCHAVWQLYDLDKSPINAPLKPWKLSLDLEVANQVKHIKKLMLSRPNFDRRPDQSLIASTQLDDEFYITAIRGNDGCFAFIYFPNGKSIQLNLTLMTGEYFKSTWFDPRTGVEIKSGKNLMKGSNVLVSPPSEGRGNDWVLILDAID